MISNKKNYCEKIINYFNQPNLTVSICFVTKDKKNDSYEVFKGNLSVTITSDLKTIFSKRCKKSFGHPETKKFEPYDASQKFSNYNEFLEGNQLSDILPLLNLVKSTSEELKNIDKDFLKKLWFYVIIFNDGKDELMIFKKYSKTCVLAKSSLFAWIFKNGDFNKLNQDIFTISEKADCIYFNEKLIIRSKGNFEKIFNFLSKIKENANSAIGLIENKLPVEIANLDSFKKEWLSNEIMTRKLNNIYARKSLDKIKPEKIELLIQNGIVKNITCTKNEEGKLILSSNNSWELLNILDDVYVESLITDTVYEATSKKELLIK